MTIGYATVALTWDGSGSPGTNTWHLRTTGSDFNAATEPEGLMDLVRQFYADQNLIFRAGLRVEWDGIYHGLGPDEGNSKSFPAWSFTAGATGPDAAEALAMVVNWRSGSGGRRGRGRTFMGPLCTPAFTDAGELQPSFVAGLQAAADDLISGSEGFTNGALGVYSRSDGLLRDFTSAQVSTKYGVLRSRRD